MRHLIIKPRGIVKSGFIDYSFSDDGSVLIAGEVAVNPFPFVYKRFPFSKMVRIEADSLKSASISQGMDLNFGVLKMHVALVANQIAQVLVQLEGVGSGTGLLDLSGELISIKLLDIKGHVMGFNLEIYAVEG